MKPRTVLSGRFDRPSFGPAWPGCGAGWRSHGGASARHPDRALPRSLTVAAPDHPGRLVCVSLVGVFALHGSAAEEPSGAVGATLALTKSSETVHRLALVQGMHYGDPTYTSDVYRLNGDGTSIETVGKLDVGGQLCRVDRLTVDVPGGIAADTLQFRDCGTPASFLVFAAEFEYEDVATCPFRGHDGQVALGEIGAVLRLRDRTRLDEALFQMAQGIHACGKDLDEARGLALTFLAAVVGALLEIAPRRGMHKEQLQAAREVEGLGDPTAIAAAAVARVRRLTDGVVQRASRTGDALIDRALEVMSRNFTASLDADSIAKELNLSTSHFRHLFREATRQPFHKYLVSMRLEKARELLLQTETPVTEIAETVGFLSPAHFSRAFHKRFGMAPSALRQTRR
jgi:AraC-like DNA-binding protein